MVEGRFAFAIPGSLETRTGGYIYDRQVMDRLRDAGWRVDYIELPATFPFPSAGDVDLSIALLNAREDGIPVLVDGLAWGAVPHELASRVRGPVVALCHHPLALENGIDARIAEHFRDNEAMNLALAARIVVTSAMTAETLALDFSVPRERIAIAEPGTQRFARAAGSKEGMAGDGAVALLAVGSIIARKGYDVLVEALASTRDLPWTLRLAGSQERASDVARNLRASVRRHSLEDRIVLLGEVGDAALAAAYGSADVFVLSSHYEGYGMVLAEAMAHGLAIVTTTGGAAATTVPDDAAIKVAPGDAKAMAGALRAVVADATLRRKLSDASWRAGRALPTWTDTAALVASAIQSAGARI